MNPQQQLSQILPALNGVVERISPWQLTDPTPCDEFNVSDILDHMIVLGGSFGSLFRGEEPPEIDAPAVAGWVPAPEFTKTMDDLLDAVHSPGAMERTVPTPLGEMPGETFARLVAFDGLIHGWDLASSVGADFEVPAQVVASVDEFARQALTDDMRDGDMFKAATTPPTGASALEALAAFSGRSLR